MTEILKPLQTFQEIIERLYNEKLWGDILNHPYNHNYDSKPLKYLSPLLLYKIFANSEKVENEKFANTDEIEYFKTEKENRKALLYISKYIIEKLGNISIDEQYSTDETICSYDVIFHFKKSNIYIKIEAWKDSQNNIFFIPNDWKEAKEVVPILKDVFSWEVFPPYEDD